MVIGIGLSAIELSKSQSSAPDPFAFLAPTIQINAADRARIERGETIVNILPAKGHEVAMVAMAQTTMSPERLVAWSADIERLKDTPGVLRVKRLSPAPALDEFASLELPAEDLRDARDCYPGACNVKLTADEMNRMRREMRSAGSDWLARGNAAFREIARENVVAYLSGGLAALPRYADGHGDASRAEAFNALIANLGFLEKVPAFKSALLHHGAPEPGVTSFTYWSVEQHDAKPIVSATHTAIATSADPSKPPVLVAGKQIFATHYASASLNVVALIRRPGPGPPYYLVVVNRSTIDATGGLFGGITRHVIESRMRRDMPDLVAAFKKRIEAGPPRR